MSTTAKALVAVLALSFTGACFVKQPQPVYFEPVAEPIVAEPAPTAKKYRRW